ncbi:MAG: ABC transporter ATP-binding protein [Actinomycetales bacterium]
MTAPAVLVDSLRMAFGQRTVIDDLSFEVRRGETFGLLGSNGCGKTTTIRALLGIYQPSAGRALIDGRRFGPRDGHSLGYLPEERGLYRKEKVLSVMTYFGRLKGMSTPQARAAAMTFLDRVGLAGLAASRLDKLSGGQQQKVQLGVTLMNNPPLLILDEPTKGFDPVNRRLLMDLVDERRRAGATVLVVTHQMDEVERLCDRVLLLKDGHARAYGTIAEVTEEFSGARLKVRFTGTLPDSARFDVRVAETNYAELQPRPGVDPSAVISELAASPLELHSIETARASMEEVFLRVYGDQEEDHHGAGRKQIAEAVR